MPGPVGGCAWGRRSLMVVTGASRGIGRAVALEAATRVAEGSLLVLVARSRPRLEEVASAVRAKAPGVDAVCAPADLEQAVSENLLSGALSDAGREDLSAFEVALLVHSAGSVGDVSERAASAGDAAKWTPYLSLNVSSAAALTAHFLALLAAAGCPARRYVVNLTSLAAVQPFPSLAYYCVGRAARQMYFTVLAAEEPNVAVLNYSPGVVDTDMVAAIEAGAADQGVRNSFADMRRRGDVVTPQRTAEVMCRLLDTGAFTSGERIDYYDVKDVEPSKATS